MASASDISSRLPSGTSTVQRNHYFVDVHEPSFVFVWSMRLLEKLSVVAKQRGMAESTIECYSLWIRQFLRFSAVAHGKWVHPSELGTADVEEFLNDMVVRRKLAGSTQNQALNALVFLYKRVLDAIPQDHLGKFLLQRSKRPKRVPTVLSMSVPKNGYRKTGQL